MNLYLQNTKNKLPSSQLLHMETPRLILFLLLMLDFTFIVSGENASAVKVDVGVILDSDSISGKMRQTYMSLALSDFYANRNHRTQIVPHFRSFISDDVDAASAAIELLKNVEVQAILGPQSSTLADFITDIGKKVKVPIISPATSPALSPTQNPYFIRVAYCSCAQAKAIAAIVQAFGWREVVFIYENSNFGSEFLPHLADAMMGINVSVLHRSVLSPSADDDQIMVELLKLKTRQTRVFVVHLHPSFASKFFKRVNEAEMMSSGYVWIITDAFTSTLVSTDPSVLDSLHGVIGVKPYVPSSGKLDNFTKRWKSKKFRQQNPDMDGVELNVFGLWAYDSVIALATALEKVGTSDLKFRRTISRENSTDLDAIGTSEFGPLLLESIRNIKLRGLSGDFHIVDGELQPYVFQIVNIGRQKGIGFWKEKYGISKNQNPKDATVYSANKDDLGAIIWPGDSTAVPRGWEIPTGEKKLRVGVPVKGGLEQLVKVTIDPQTNATVATGFCVDVFEQVMDSMPYYVPFEYTAINQSGNHPIYDSFVNQVFIGELDAVVGDITILSRRSNHVDFTFPFTESGVIIVVPVQQDNKKNAWIFLKPMSKQLWMVTAMFFVFIGTVIWVLEHQVNNKFRGPRHKQVGMIFWFSFSTLVFAHRERVISNLSRFVLVVWVFVVLVLTSSYTASLTSMLTVQQLQPTVTDINDLIKNREYVGCRDGSFVAGMLKNKFGSSIKLRNYTTLEEFDEALTKGSKNDGIAAIVDELPYLRIFLGKYCRKYTIVGPTYKTSGFGFTFPKGSPLVPDVSRAILSVTESDAMIRITDKWFGNETDCTKQDGALVGSDSLALDSFKGLFIIAGVSASSALLIFFCSFLNRNKGILTSDISILQKLSALAKAFHEEIDSSRESQKLNEGVVSSPEVMSELYPESPETNIPHSPSKGFIIEDEGFGTTELGSPVHDSISLTEEITAER